MRGMTTHKNTRDLLPEPARVAGGGASPPPALRRQRKYSQRGRYAKLARISGRTHAMGGGVPAVEAAHLFIGAAALADPRAAATSGAAILSPPLFQPGSGPALTDVPPALVLGNDGRGQALSASDPSAARQCGGPAHALVRLMTCRVGVGIPTLNQPHSGPCCARIIRPSRVDGGCYPQGCRARSTDPSAAAWKDTRTRPAECAEGAKSGARTGNAAGLPSSWYQARPALDSSQAKEPVAILPYRARKLRAGGSSRLSAGRTAGRRRSAEAASEAKSRSGWKPRAFPRRFRASGWGARHG